MAYNRKQSMRQPEGVALDPQGWSYTLDGDRVHKDWSMTQDGEYHHKDARINLDGEYELPRPKGYRSQPGTNGWDE